MDLIALSLALFLGFGLGGLFFGGLWLTVRRLTSATHPAPWFLVSFALRSGVVLAGFYLLAGSWQQLVAGLLGFLLARILLTRLVGQEVLRGLKS